MASINLSTFSTVKPMIYAYTTPEIARHDGWTKIGYTEKDVIERIKEQTQTADIKWKLEWQGNALFEDGSYERFTDKDFHAYLRNSGIEQGTNDNGKLNEWLHIVPPDARIRFFDFKSNHGILQSLQGASPYTLRSEQEDAVSKTADFYYSHQTGDFLWNAKPRFGKTLSVYDFCKRVKAMNVLIVTNRPAIANSWYQDYIHFIGKESGYFFVSEVDALKGKPDVFSRQGYINQVHLIPDDEFVGCIEFVSLQDMKGSVYFGGHFDKLREVHDMTWDVLVIDEAHEGVDTYKTDAAFDQIKCRFKLHLSGTPFKALANNKFKDDAIFNWTYADEQQKKNDWDDSNEEENPYAALPKLNLFTYQMSEIIREELSQGIEINGETEEYAFDLNEFFKTTNGHFDYDSAVDKFLDALTTQEKFPFSTPELRNELKHTFWLLNRVESARALAKKLESHPVFKNYKIVLAAGDGKIDDDSENQKSYDKVIDAIAHNDKTITLSVGQLTTGVTIPEWTAVMMLSNVKSPSLYMQAAFRAQNPCMFQDGANFARKENAYVFDFDPARTLIIFEEFANDLSSSTASGRGDIETRKENIRTLLNFFPVIGEDENGEMIPLDAEKVLTIPRKIKSVEVVKRGFMSNFLFQNISMIFSAPQAVREILENINPVKESKNNIDIPSDVKEKLSLDEDGNVVLTEEYVIGKEQDLFGEKIYETTPVISDILSNVEPAEEAKKGLVEQIKEIVIEKTVKPTIQAAKDEYGEQMKRSDERQLESRLKSRVNDVVEHSFNEYQIKQNILEQQRKDAIANANSDEEEKQINTAFSNQKQTLSDDFKVEVLQILEDIETESKHTVVEVTETRIKERERTSIEDDIRDRLRGFARTIPSFLMAYGSEDVSLDTFDTIIPDSVFLDVTSITLDQFRFLRDGGYYYDEEKDEEVWFEGHLFDPVVFDDSVKEFLNLKKRLSNYFDETSTEDIFDYIPPQKTNQIFTPKAVVSKMVDILEAENPGCFDDPNKTFIDLYMKSGLYIAEIVKRLYRSDVLKSIYPNNEDRLNHIFEKQVFGLAPTEIIYNIALSYILGFNDNFNPSKHNLKLADATPFTKEGKLKELIDSLFEGSTNA